VAPPLCASAATFSDGVREHAPSKIQGLLESPWDETRALEHASERRRLLEQLEGELQEQEHLEDGTLGGPPPRGGCTAGRGTRGALGTQAGGRGPERGGLQDPEEEGGPGVGAFADGFGIRGG